MESLEILLRFLVVITLWSVVYSDCPSTELVYPCSCLNSDITCGAVVTKLDLVFKALTDRSTVKSFNQLFLKNVAITALENNTFNNVSFHHITIENATKLERIEANAFGSTAALIQDFRLTGRTHINATSTATVENLFGALRSLVNAKNITLDPYLLQSIPNSAFKLPDGQHHALEHLSFNDINSKDGTLHTIGREAFYSLTKLSTLYLNGHQIEYIRDNVFNFGEPSTDSVPLIINLSDNNLEGNSFEFGSFVLSQRPIVLALDDNPITYLDDKVFNPFVHRNPNNRVILKNDQISCDCRMHWLIKLRFEIRDTIKEQVSDIVCHGGPNAGKSFWELKLADFDECLSGSSI